MAIDPVSGHDRCPLTNLKFDSSFFADEVREGFFVPTMMKRFWAAQMIVLSKIAEICERHGIKWFADYGTLLGAVRHGGYIPWDDDFDICMMRSDYIKFFEVARSELPPEYVILNMHTSEEYQDVFGRINNSAGIDYSESHLRKYAGCPYSVGIDIFPLDNVSDDEDLENSRCERAKLISGAAGMIDKGLDKTRDFRDILSTIERENHVVINKNKNIRKQLVLLSEKVYTEFSEEPAEYVALMRFWTLNNRQKHKRDIFDSIVRIPFENTYINAPARYREMLTGQYGDFFKIYKSGGAHDYPAYGSQEAIFRKAIGHNPFKFTLTKDQVTCSRDAVGLDGQISETISMLFEAHDKIAAFMKSGNTHMAHQLLEGCQNLAVSLGTLAEERLENCSGCVKLLEEYCEVVFGAYNEWTDLSQNTLDSKAREFQSAFDELLKSRKKKILFLSFKAEWWPSIEPLYRTLSGDPQNDVCVMSVPYSDDDVYSDEKKGTRDDSFLLPGYVKKVSAGEYDIDKEHPDMIITTCPYDDQSTVFRIPDYFCSRNLLGLTGKLVYVPCFDVDDPGDVTKAEISLNSLIEQPAVLYADEVIVKSDELKSLYCRRLAELSGNREYWESKISIFEDTESKPMCLLPDEWKAVKGRRKLLLLSVDAAFITENPDTAIGKILSAIDHISEASSDIVCVFVQGADIESLDRENPAIQEGLIKIRNRISECDNIITDPAGIAARCIEAFAGYFGTENALANKCRNSGIPIMLINANVKR